jgi:hypothetical protein
MCCPCFIEYTTFQSQAARRRKLEFALAGAALVILVVIGAWLWRVKWGRGIPERPQVVTLDLRNWRILRGEEIPPGNKPLVLPRGQLDLSIYLPIGSREGNYEVQVVKEPGKVLASAFGSAALVNHNAVLRVEIGLSRASAGTYLLRIDGSEWIGRTIL